MASGETTFEAARDKSVNSSFLSTWDSHEWIALIELLKHHAAQIMQRKSWYQTYECFERIRTTQLLRMAREFVSYTKQPSYRIAASAKNP
jgi:hypothetical protein